MARIGAELPRSRSVLPRMEPRRRRLRLRRYDYASAGLYYVTTCVEGRLPLFGRVVDHAMTLSAAGRMVERTWREIPVAYRGVALDEFVVMPDHIHGVIVLIGEQGGRTRGSAPTATLADVIQRFKTLTTTRYCEGVAAEGWHRFNGPLWQRNYYEHIIRGERALEAIRVYIEGNPAESKNTFPL